MRLVGVGIVAHLADVGATVLVVGHRDGTRDERLRGEEVHAKTVEHAKGLCGVAGGCGGDAGEFGTDGIVRSDHALILLGGEAEVLGRGHEENQSPEKGRHEANELKVVGRVTPCAPSVTIHCYRRARSDAPYLVRAKSTVRWRARDGKNQCQSLL